MTFLQKVVWLFLPDLTEISGRFFDLIVFLKIFIYKGRPFMFEMNKTHIQIVCF